MNNTTSFSNTNTFSTIDYIFFALVLLSSTLIGFYFGFFAKKQNSPEEYLQGGKKMKLLPVACSLVASDVSCILILGFPADVYLYGSASYWSCISSFLANFAIIYVYLPVFFKLQTISCFEYLKMRFSSRIRNMASMIYTINQLLYLPIVMWTSVLAFGQVSQINLNLLTIVVCVICITYTCFGGIKAVVWTDTLQMIIMIGSLLIVFALGIHIEGFSRIWDVSYKGGRLDLNLGFDPTVRTASFTIIIGMTIYCFSFGCNPMYFQRYLSLPTKKQARMGAHSIVVGIIFFKTITTLLGFIIYTRYENCDPISNGNIQKLDQLVPYYIMDVASTLPGLPGIFIAGVFCAALSTMSSFLNTLAGTIYEDFFKDRMPANTSKKRASDIMKIIVAVLGIISMVLVFVVQHLGGIMELTLVFRGIVTGPVLAMFSLGMLLPIVNEKGMFYGAIGGAVTMIWLLIGAKYYTLTGKIKKQTLHLSTIDCETTNSTITGYVTEATDTASETGDEPFYFYRISFYYYTFVGVVGTTIVAVIVSLLTKQTQKHNKDLFSPVIYRFLAKDDNHDAELVHLNKKLNTNGNKC